MHPLLLPALTASVALAALPRADAAASARPNVLFLAIDDLRPELGAYGQKHVFSPNIDRLAAEGVLFQRAYCQAPICMSSRASLLTSRHPTRTTITSRTAVIERDLAGSLTLPQVFRQHGYYAIANGKIMHEAKDSVAVSWDEPVWLSPHWTRSQPGSARQKDVGLSSSHQTDRNAACITRPRRLDGNLCLIALGRGRRGQAPAHCCNAWSWTSALVFEIGRSIHRA